MAEDKNVIQSQDAEVVDEFRHAIIESHKVIEAYNATYLPQQATATVWQGLGAVKDYQKQVNGLVLHCENGYAQLHWTAPNSVRVRVQNHADFSDYFSYHAVHTSQAELSLRVSESSPYARDESDTIYIETDSHTYRINKTNFAVAVDTRYGRTIYSETVGISWSNQGEARLQSQLKADESSYGTGERAFDLNLRGRKLELWNVDPGGYQRGDDPVNYCVSFYLGVHELGAYGLLWDNPAKGTMDIGASQADELNIYAETGQISYYLFAADDVISVLAAYSQVTGKMLMPPLWALGYQQCRYSYMTSAEVLETAKTFREKNIPCDVIYLDIHYMDKYKIFTWDKKAFPDMKGMIDKLHAMGMKLVVILDPGVKVEKGYAGHDSGVAEEIFITYPDGKITAGVVWPGLCYFPDFTNPKAREWWAKQLSDLLNCGVDGLWNDMNEPLIFHYEEKPHSLPNYSQQSKEGRGGNHHELHNVYGMQMGRASHMALNQHRAGKRQFNIIRAGAAGAQRDSLAWTGDNYATWDDLRLCLSMCLQMNLSGVSFVGGDVGGFNLDTSPELLTRWTQAGSLLPMFRNHSAIGTARQEPWAFGKSYETLIRAAIELRYRLMPYLYTAFAEAAFYGYPIIRPIFTAEPNNPQIRNIDDSYLLSDKLLVAPVLTAETLRRTVYLPDGLWYDFYSHERYEGGRIINVEAPLEKLPLFVKSGTVLPMWDVLQYMGEKALETLTLRIYTDTGTSRLYEDAGEGFAYQNGDYRWTTFSCVEGSNSLLLERQVQGAYQPTYFKIQLELVGARSAITYVKVDGQPYEAWRFENSLLTVDLGLNFSSIEVGN